MVFKDARAQGFVADGPRRADDRDDSLYSVDEILGLSNEQLDQFVFCGEPIVFRAGSAEILGKFERTPDRLILELAHIDGGAESALPALGALASRYAAREHLAFLEWQVHAVNCANPNHFISHVRSSELLTGIIMD